MCGIGGFVMDNAVGFKSSTSRDLPSDLKILTAYLLKENMARGARATGIAAITKELDFGMYKKAIMADLFVKEDKYSEFAKDFLHDKTRIVFGHTRLPTKGAAENNFNNHPILSGSVAGVHNGCISNDELLWRTKGEPKERRALVDSEIIFHLIDLYSRRNNYDITSSIYETSKHLVGSYACAMVHLKKPKFLWLFCKGNPIYLYCAAGFGLKVFASSESYIENALARIGLGVVPRRISKVPEGTGLRIDANSGKIQRIALKTSVACII